MTPPSPADPRGAVVLITGTGSNSFGTGFIVHRDAGATFIVTAAHVVQDLGRSGTIQVEGVNATAITSTPFSGSEQIDLAVLRVDKEFASALRLRGNSVQGRDVMVLGSSEAVPSYGRRLDEYPGTLGAMFHFRYSMRSGGPILGWDVEFPGNKRPSSGCSGGPVLDAQTHEVVAVLVAKRNDGNSQMAISAEAIKRVWPGRIPFRFVDDEEKEAAMNEIRASMATLIPGFGDKFPGDLRDHLISEMRQERLFKVKPTNALVFGYTGVGKTTTINFLMGAPIFPTSGELSCTRSLSAGEHESGLTFYDSPGTGDEPTVENVTRVALNIAQLQEEQVPEIPLIDLTPKGRAGPEEHRARTYEDFKNEINADFYSSASGRIALKSSPADKFGEWAHGRFDFLVFMTSSEHGLNDREARLLEELHNARGGEIKLFKVYNVMSPSYDGKDTALDERSKKRLEQAKSRLRDRGLPDANQWIILDSKTGVGVSDLIKAFTKSLPVDVLRTLYQTIDEQFSQEIEEGLARRYLDYAEHVAAVLAVLPVNYQHDGHDFLQYTLASLITVAEYIFSGERGQVTPEVLDDLIDKLRGNKRHTQVETYYKTKKIKVPKQKIVEVPVTRMVPKGIAREVRTFKPKPNRFYDWVEDRFDVDLHSYEYQAEIVWEQVEVEETVMVEVEETVMVKKKKTKRKTRFAGYTYEIGGLEAIELALTVTTALERAYRETATVDTARMGQLLAECNEAIAAALTDEVREQMTTLIEEANQTTEIQAKVEVANDRLQPVIHQLLKASA